ncbi:hypothetical protein [Polaribacter sp.]|uniref:hypothetical protein n=1 Tax=Polaribacter sp. TaxID=1920175 RepID=UPI003F6ADD95
MKKLLLLFAVLTSSFHFAQDKDINQEIIKVTKMSVEVDSAEELETIDWKDIKEVFAHNTKNEAIEMSFSLHYPKSKNKIKSAIKVGGKSKNIDSLIVIAKKGIKAIIKLANNHKN